MKEKYNVYVNGDLAHSNLSEEDFFDVMEDYAKGCYDNGTINPDQITYKVIIDD